MAKNRRGFTLIELVVVVLIMGILASMGVPYYFKTLETSKATDSIAIGHLLGNANRMYLMDNPAGISGQITNTCNNSAITCAAASNACKLVSCGYVAQQDWDSSSYSYFACNGGAGGGCCAANVVACSSRKAPSSGQYSTWGYRFFNSGTCQPFGTNTPSCPAF